MEDVVDRLRRTRANMLGTDDGEHFHDCHDAAKEIELLRKLLSACRNAMRESMDISGRTDWSDMIQAIDEVVTPNVEVQGLGAALSRRVPWNVELERIRTQVRATAMKTTT